MRSTLVIVLVVLLVLVAYLGARGEAGEARASGDDAQADDRGGGEDSPILAAMIEDAERRAASTRVTAADAASGIAPPPDDLRARLRRLGELYVAFGEAGLVGEMSPELERELRAALESIVNHPDVARRVLGMLQTGELTPLDGVGMASEKLNYEETGAFWSQFWAFCSYNGAGDLLHASVRVDGVAFALDVFAALVWIRPPVGRQLARHLLNGTDAEGQPILDRRFLPDLMALARAHPEVAALRALLLGLAERLEPYERMEILRFYLPADDPDRMIAEIKAYLGGPSEAQGIQMASILFEEADDDELRARIAVSVLGGAEDGFAAAEFLARHAGVLKNDPMALYTMAVRDDAVPALESEYRLLLGAGADARARETLVLAMENADPKDLLAIASEDPTDAVSVSALWRATTVRDADPDPMALELLRELGPRRTRMTTLELVNAASNLATAFRRSAQLAESNEARDFLIEVAQDPNSSDYIRESTRKKLLRLMSEEEVAAIFESVTE